MGVIFPTVDLGDREPCDAGGPVNHSSPCLVMGSPTGVDTLDGS